MKLIKEKGHVMKFKARREKGESEEHLWWKFWNKGDMNKEILKTKLPVFSTKFEQWNQDGKSPYDEVVETVPYAAEVST